MATRTTVMAVNEEYTKKHYWSGMHSYSNYQDKSEKNPNLPQTIYYPRDIGAKVRIVSTCDGHFPNKYMLDGYQYGWKVWFKMWVKNSAGTTVATITSGSYSIQSDNTNGNAKDVHIDPVISLSLTPTSAPPSQTNQYIFYMEVHHELQTKSGDNDWTDWSDYTSAATTDYFYLVYED